MVNIDDNDTRTEFPLIRREKIVNVYCKLISVDDNVIKYAIGGLYSDLTGELIVYKSGYRFKITKKPENSVILINNVDSLLRKHRNEFRQGIYKEEISREIG